MATQVQILYKAVCISYNVRTLGKGINPTILFLRLRVNTRADWAYLVTGLQEGKLNSNLLNLKN